MTGTVHGALRSATGAAHDALERRLDVRSVRGTAGYAALLTGFAVVLPSLEDRLRELASGETGQEVNDSAGGSRWEVNDGAGGSPRAVNDGAGGSPRAVACLRRWADEDRSGRVRIDLAQLGVAAAAVPAPAAAPDLADAAEGLGACYVLEGSALGGQLIADHARRVGVPGNACTYFRGAGPATGRRWRELRADLEAVGGSDVVTRGAIVQGARVTFDLFARHLAGPPAAGAPRGWDAA